MDGIHGLNIGLNMKLNKDDLYWTNKKHTTYAVLVSPGYGAGWSTWNSEHGGEKLAYDKRIVEYFVARRKTWDKAWSCKYYGEVLPAENEFREFLKSIGYDADNIYLGGAPVLS